MRKLGLSDNPKVPKLMAIRLKEALIIGIENVMKGNIYYDLKLIKSQPNLHHVDLFVK